MDFMSYVAESMPYLLDGLAFSAKLFAVVVLVGFPLSIVFAILKSFGPRWLKAILNVYTWFFRGSPLLLQLSLAYFGLPVVGIVLPTNVVVFSIFILSATAYETEVVRGGLISIDKGQYEACEALGIGKFKTMLRIVVPQTIRKVLPPSCSEAIILFKDTSLVTAVAEFDLLRAAKNLVISDARVDAFVIALFFYLLISSILVIVFEVMEKRLLAKS